MFGTFRIIPKSNKFGEWVESEVAFFSRIFTYTDEGIFSLG